MNVRILAALFASAFALAACSSDSGTGTGTGGSTTNPSGGGSSSSSSSSFTCCVNKAFYKCGSESDMSHCAKDDMSKFCPRDSSQDDKCKD